MPAYRQRNIDAPAKEYLDAKEAAAFLGISKEAFKGLADAKKIPPAVVVNRENVLWHWTTILGVSLLLGFLLGKEPGEAG